MGYGFSEDTVRSTKHFGLNTGKIIKIEWVNDPVEALNVEILIDGDTNPMRYKKFPVNKVFSGNVEIVAGDESFSLELAKQERELSGVLTHIMKPFVTTDAIKAAVGTNKVSFGEYVKILISLLPKDYMKVPLDIFLQYQWNIPDGKENSFLEIPKNMKHGNFIHTHVTPVGSWKKDVTSGLKYIDDNNNNIHPFTRTSWFLSSNFAKLQKSGFQGSESTDGVASEVLWN